MTRRRSRSAVLSCLAAALALAAAAAATAGPAAAQVAKERAGSEAAGRTGGAGERVLTADDFKGLSFRSIGPANMGGRAAAIAIVPGSRTSFYVGFATGGVWKTENLGVTFSPLFDAEPLLSIGAIAVGGEEGKIVWVGTGEGNNRNSSSWGNGVYRSADGGKTWDHVGLDETHDIPRLALDPRNADVCYVAALGHLWGPNPERGVFKTTDAGRTWKQILKVDENTGACDVVVDPSHPETVYAALYARRRTPWSYEGTSDKGGVFRSDDAGATWKKLTAGLPPRTGRIGLALYAKNTRVLYADVESDSGGAGHEAIDNYSTSGGVFRSDDRGDHWTRTSALDPRPFYFSRIAVDPENDQRVYLPGWDLGISDDGGKTFRRSGSPKVHVDFHAIAINPLDPAQIVVGNDGGIYISHDKAKSWDFLDNMAVGQFYRIAVDQSDPYRVAGGLQDNGSYLGPSETLYKSEDSAPGEDDKDDGILNADWRTIFGADGFTVQFDPVDPNIVYATGQGAMIGRVRLDDNEKKFIRPSPREGQARFRFNWNAPFFVSPHDPTVLYLGGNRVFKLTERGDRWEAISPDLSRNDPVKTATVGSDAETYGTVVSLAESPVVKGLLWAGTDDGRVHVTRDDGRTWTEVTPKEVGGLYVSRLAPSRRAGDTVYLAVDGHRSDDYRTLLFMTEDAGKTWKSIAGDLPPKEPVQVVIEAMDSVETLYAGTEFGLYVTEDRGRHWVRLNGKTLPPAPVDDLVIHPRERDLVVATHGRSLWILDDASPIAHLTSDVRRKPLHLFDILPATPRLYTGRGYGGGAGIFRAPNPPMGAIINYWLRDPSPDGVKIAIADPAGTTIRELTGTGRAGLNRVVWDLQADAKHRIPTIDAQRMDQTMFVGEGDYKVSVSLDVGVPGKPEKAEAAVHVKKSPGAAPGTSAPGAPQPSRPPSD